MITDIKKYKILKEGRSIDISIEETKKYIENKNIDLNNLKNIYRGTYSDHTSKYLFIDPKLHNRASANTFNYYTLIMDNNELWKEYPKRSKSFSKIKSVKRSNSTRNLMPCNSGESKMPNFSNVSPKVNFLFFTVTKKASLSVHFSKY